MIIYIFKFIFIGKICLFLIFKFFCFPSLLPLPLILLNCFFLNSLILMAQIVISKLYSSSNNNNNLHNNNYINNNKCKIINKKCYKEVTLKKYMAKNRKF